MITATASVRVFEAVKGPAHRGQNLADKLQRLVLEQPRIAVQIEQLVDVYLATDGAR